MFQNSSEFVVMGHDDCGRFFFFIVIEMFYNRPASTKSIFGKAQTDLMSGKISKFSQSKTPRTIIGKCCASWLKGFLKDSASSVTLRARIQKYVLT